LKAVPSLDQPGGGFQGKVSSSVLFPARESIAKRE
jgi:hypothetical protein